MNVGGIVREPVCIGRTEKGIGCPVLFSLRFIPLKQGFALNLELGWWRASP